MNTEQRIIDIEALPIGVAWAAPVAEARHAIAVDRERAAAIIFPSTIRPASAGAYSALTAHADRWSLVNPAQSAAETHRRALEHWPELAALLRTTDVVADIGALAASRASPTPSVPTTGAAQRAAAQDAIRLYERLVAEQLTLLDSDGDAELAPAARALLAAEQHAARVDVVEGRHKAHAAAELERQAAEQRQIDRELRDRTVVAAREAAARAAEAEQLAQRSAVEARRARGELLAARLRASGRKLLRVGREGGTYDVADLIATAPRCSAEQIARYEDALDAAERGQ